MRQEPLCATVDALLEQVGLITRALDKYDLLNITGEARLQGSTWEVSDYHLASWVAGESLPLEATDHYVRFKDGNLEIRGGKFDIHTGESGARFQMDGEGMVAWDAGDVETFNLDFTTGALTLTGTITAAAGSIGGWTIAATQLSAGAAGTFVALSSAVTAGDDYRIWAGAAAGAAAPFSITEAGVLKAASGTIGGWTLCATGFYNLAANVGIILDASTPFIRVGDTGATYIELEGASGHIGTSDFSSGVRGWRVEQDGNAEFANIIARGVFRTPVFLKDEVTAIGGTFLVAESDVLTSDCTTAAVDASFDFVCAHNYFAVNDYVRCKPDGTRQFWALITAIAGVGPYTYSATMKNGDTATDFYTGEAIANYGASGAGQVQMTATAANSPYVDIFTHAGSPWAALTHRVRLGNLEGVEAGGGYGLWADNVFLTGKITATDGDFSAVDISGLLTMLAGGEIRVGDGGTPDADFNGLRMYQTAAPLYRLEGQKAGVVQFYVDNEGKLRSGHATEYLLIDVDGLEIYQTGNANWTTRWFNSDIATYGNACGFATLNEGDPAGGHTGSMDFGIWHDADNQTTLQLFLNEYQFAIEKAGTWYFPVTVQFDRIHFNTDLRIVAGGIAVGENAAVTDGDVQYTNNIQPKRGASYWPGSVMILYGHETSSTNYTFTTSFADIGVGTTETVPAGYLFITATVLGLLPAYAGRTTMVIRLLVDGVEVERENASTSHQWDKPSVTLSWAGTVAAGSKTWKLQGLYGDTNNALRTEASGCFITWMFFT